MNDDQKERYQLAKRLKEQAAECKEEGNFAQARYLTNSADQLTHELVDELLEQWYGDPDGLPR